MPGGKQGGSNIPQQGMENSKYFGMSGPGAAPAHGAPCVPSSVPGFAGVAGGWFPQENMGPPLILTVRLGDTKFKGNFKMAPYKENS